MENFIFQNFLHSLQYFPKGIKQKCFFISNLLGANCMKHILFILSLLTFLFFLQNLLAQTPQPTQTPPEDEDVVKISTTLIQMDVVVTDKKGNQITDLKPEDFEIYENGKKQIITNFSYIETSSTTNAENKTEKSESVSKNKNGIPIPPVKLKSEQIRRTYALVVDDLGLSFESVVYVKRSLKKFIDEQVQEGDLVAIVRTGGGIGALQSFTNNKQQLYAAIEKIRWNSYGRSGIGAFESITTTLKEDLEGTVGSDGSVTGSLGNAEDREFEQQIDEFRQDNFAYGTLGALRYIIRGMGELPGRKSVILFSEGFQSLSRQNGVTSTNGVFEGLRRLADFANRSSVVFYTLDPRGLVNPLMATAEDNITKVLPDDLTSEDKFYTDPRDLRNSKFIDSQQTLAYLAYQTGGFPFINRNNLDKGLEEIVEDQKGYYLIAYEPNDETFDPKKSRFNKLKINVLRDDLKIRYRSGFFGIPDEKLANVKQTIEQQVYGALTSPFGAGDIALSVNTIFAEESKQGMFLEAIVFINGKDLKFSDEPDGTKKANFDIIAMTFGDNGQRVDEASRNYTIKVNDEMYQKVLAKGFIYNLTVPIKKPGAYQFRVALRDSATAKVGAASQFIEIPNLKKDRLTLSSIVLNNYSADEWRKISTGQNISSQNEENGNFETNVATALREFKTGTVLQYGYIIYNAKSTTSQKPQLEIQAKLFQDGKVILAGNPSLFNPSDQNDIDRLQSVGAITLGKSLKPGNYVLQIIVTDKLAKQKHQVTSNWVEFEIVE